MTRRNELRDKALDYFLEHGLAELSLRPLAEAIGTSARLLAYHFESKEKLITSVMGHLRTQVQGSVLEMMRARGGAPSLQDVWRWATDAANIRHVRLLFEVQVLALQHPEVYAQFAADSSASWLAVIEQGIPESPDRRAIARLCSAVIDGLVLDYMTSGDLRQASAALDVFVSLLNQRTGAVGARPSPGEHRDEH